MPDSFHDGSRSLQDRFETRELADYCYGKLVRDRVNPKQKAFIESADMFFLATSDEKNQPTCSYKGGDPGFVRVLDDEMLAIPNYDGDGKYLSWGNILKNPNIGMIFIDFQKAWRLRVHGIATINHTDELLTKYPGAQFIVRVKIREIFGNCPRYIHKYQRTDLSSFVPRANEPTPIPDWKKQPDWNKVLPKNDPAKQAEEA